MSTSIGAFLLPQARAGMLNGFDVDVAAAFLTGAFVCAASDPAATNNVSTTTNEPLVFEDSINLLYAMQECVPTKKSAERDAHRQPYQSSIANESVGADLLARPEASAIDIESPKMRLHHGGEKSRQQQGNRQAGPAHGESRHQQQAERQLQPRQELGQGCDRPVGQNLVGVDRSGEGEPRHAHFQKRGVGEDDAERDSRPRQQPVDVESPHAYFDNWLSR